MSDDRVTDWCKAKRSNATNTCVEMRRNGTSVEIRDTKAQGAGPILAVSAAVFHAWIDSAKLGELDKLA